MDKYTIYGFIAGLHLGRFTNFISNTLITGIVLYFIEPNFYTYENFSKIKLLIKSGIN